MKHRGAGSFGVELNHPREGMIRQWFKSEVLRNEYYGNLCRNPEYREARPKKVEKQVQPGSQQGVDTAPLICQTSDNNEEPEEIGYLNNYQE